MNQINLDHWYWRIVLVVAMPFIIIGWTLFVVYSLTMILPLIEWLIFGKKSFTINYWNEAFEWDIWHGRD